MGEKKLWMLNSICPQCGGPIEAPSKFQAAESGLSYCSKECAETHLKERKEVKEQLDPILGWILVLQDWLELKNGVFERTEYPELYQNHDKQCVKHLQEARESYLTIKEGRFW